MILNTVRFIIGVFCTTALFWAGMLFEHRPAGWPNLNVPLPFGAHWTFQLPDGPYVKLTVLQAREAQAGRQVVALQARQLAIATRANAAQAAVQLRIQTVTKTLIKEVPVYVDRQAVAACTVNTGFVRLYNAAVVGESLPGGDANTASGANDAPSGVGLDTVARVSITNLGKAHSAIEQVRGWQTWYQSEYQAWLATRAKLANPAK